MMLVYLTDGEQIWIMRPVRALAELAEMNRQADEVTQGMLYWVTFAEWREMRRQQRLAALQFYDLRGQFLGEAVTADPAQTASELAHFAHVDADEIVWEYAR